MKALIRPIILLLCCLVIPVSSFRAQVGNVKSNIEEDQANEAADESANTIDSSEGSDLVEENFTLLDLFDGIGLVFRGFAALQSYSLRGQKQYPHRTSLALPVSYGFGNNDFKNHFLQAGLNAHWGVFGTDFKYRRLKDVTGTLEMADWLIGLFRIPIHQVNIAYGLGNIYILGEDQKYVNQAVGISIDLQKPHLSIEGRYQWSQRTTLDARFLKSLTCSVGYHVFESKGIHFYPTLEVNHQNYFDEDQFWLISAGLRLMIY